jgi:hypothetical protein
VLKLYNLHYFKVRGPKHIFSKTSGPASMFDAFVIEAYVLLISSLTKKLKIIGF